MSIWGVGELPLVERVRVRGAMGVSAIASPWQVLGC